MIAYLKSKGHIFNKAGDEYVTACPFCKDTKHFYINDHKKVFFCHKCNEAGNMWKIKKHFGEDIKVVTTVKSEYKTPAEGKDSELFLKMTKSTEAQKYLMTDRGFTKDTIKKFNLGFDGSYISIPSYKNGRLVGIKYRSIEGKSFRREEGCESTIYNIDNIDKTKDIIITEGELDTVAAYQMGFSNVCSVSVGAGSINDDWIDFFDGCSGNVYIAYDNDKKGEEGAAKLAKRIGYERSYRVILPAKDLNDCMMSGFSFEDIKTAIANSRQYTLDKVVHATRIIERLEVVWKSPDKGRGKQLEDWPSINEKLGGIRDGELTVLTGDTGSGKTTFALNLFYSLADTESVLILSSEMPPEKVMAKLFSMYKLKPLHVMTTEDFMDAAAYFGKKKMFFIDTYGRMGIEELTECIEYCVRKYDLKYTLIDHLHFIINPLSDNQVAEIESFMKQLVGLSLKHSIHTFLIAHPAKLNNTDGKVTMNDLRGASAIKQDAHNVMIVWRDRKKEESGVNEMVLDIQKVREPSCPGGAKRYSFNIDTQIYKETENDFGTEERKVQGVRSNGFRGKEWYK